jgi:aspartate racemase
MRVLGLLGGTTYNATLLYYKQINAYVQHHLGGGHSSKLLLHSFDHAELFNFFQAGNYNEVSRQICTAAKNLKSIGAEAIVLCVNTNHRWAEDIENATGLPLLHIIDFTGDAIVKAGLKKVALLGTQISMEHDFLKGRLERKFGVEVFVPEREAARKRMDRVIFQELSCNKVLPESREFYLDEIRKMFQRGAEGVILGCTELQMILKPGDVDMPMFDTVELHAKGVAKWQLEG